MNQTFIYKATIIVSNHIICFQAASFAYAALSLLAAAVAHDWLLGGVSSCERRLNWKLGDKSSDGRLLIQQARIYHHLLKAKVMPIAAFPNSLSFIFSLWALFAAVFFVISDI